MLPAVLHFVHWPLSWLADALIIGVALNTDCSHPDIILFAVYLVVGFGWFLFLGAVLRPRVVRLVQQSRPRKG